MAQVVSAIGLVCCEAHSSLPKSKRGLYPCCDDCHAEVQTRVESNDGRVKLSKYSVARPGFWEEHKRRYG